MKLLLDLVDNLPDIRYWSNIIRYTIPNPSLTLRSKSRTLKIYVKSFLLKFLEMDIS